MGPGGDGAAQPLVELARPGRLYCEPAFDSMGGTAGRDGNSAGLGAHALSGGRGGVLRPGDRVSRLGYADICELEMAADQVPLLLAGAHAARDPEPGDVVGGLYEQKWGRRGVDAERHGILEFD